MAWAEQPAARLTALKIILGKTEKPVDTFTGVDIYFQQYIR